MLSPSSSLNSGAHEHETTGARPGVRPGVLAALALAVALPFSAVSQADPVLTLTFLNNNQTHGATDSIGIEVRLTNTGDADLSGAYGGSSLSVSFLSSIYDQYVDSSGPADWWAGYIGDHDILIGDSREWTLLTLAPWPWPGDLGDPVPEGDYALLASDLTMSLTIGGTKYDVGIPENGFSWTVGRSKEHEPPASTVPLPGTLALFGCGVIAALSSRRHRAKAEDSE